MGKIVGKFSSQFQAVCVEVIAWFLCRVVYGHSCRVSTVTWSVMGSCVVQSPQSGALLSLSPF